MKFLLMLALLLLASALLLQLGGSRTESIGRF